MNEWMVIHCKDVNDLFYSGDRDSEVYWVSNCSSWRYAGKRLPRHGAVIGVFCRG